VLKIFDKSVWLLRRLDVLIPWPGLSLLAVAHKTTVARDATPQRHPETARNAN